MKKNFKIIFIILFTFVLGISNISKAEDSTTESNFTVSSSNYYKFSQDDIIINENVDGDVFVLCAGTVTINSSITGNVFICAPNVVIGEKAKIESSIFNASENVTINGTVEKNVYFACETFKLDEKGTLNSDLFLISGDSTMAGQIGRDVFITCDTINLTNSSSIGGNLNYSSTNECDIPKEVVEGKINFSKIEKSENEVTSSVESWIMSALTIIVVALVLWFVNTKLISNFAEKNLAFTKNIGKCILIGLLTLIVTPIASITLLTFEITSALSIILILIYIILLLIASSTFIVTIASICAEKLKDKIQIDNNLRQIICIAVICLIYKALELLPAVGVIAMFTANIIGLGIAIKNIIPDKKTEITNV